MNRCIGLDTETQDGRAILIATPDAWAECESWSDCVGFLFSHGPDYILWNMVYDLRAILAWASRRALADLHVKGSCEYRDCHIRVRGKKSAQITRGKQTVHLWDALPFFESALDAAAEKYLGERKLAIPKKWLSDMAVAMADPRTRPRVIRYCMRDADLTQRLWEVLESQCQALGVSAYRAASPASVARRAFRSVFDGLSQCTGGNRTFRRSYFGGRTEIMQRGHIRNVHAYDLHSAYPGIASRLIDPASCTLTRWRGGPVRDLARRDVAYGNYHVVIHVPPDDPIPPLPYRARGRLIYPSGLFEADVDVEMFRALRSYGYDMRIVWAWEYLIDSHDLLFPDLGAWYRAREENPAVKLAAKKVLNSLYGKCAEQIHMKGRTSDRFIKPGMQYHGGGWHRNVDTDARHTCFAVAGAISGGCRVAVLRAMRVAPAHVVAVHTDGILTTRRFRPGEIDEGPGMGQWGYEGKWEDAWIIGTGTAVFARGGKWKAKMRGIHATTDAMKGILRSRFDVCPVNVRHAVTLTDASRSSFAGLNRMLTLARSVHANMDRKRHWPREWASFREMAVDSQRSDSIVVVEKRALTLWKGGA